jgi:purine-binding chemotaxis protein CheW
MHCSNVVPPTLPEALRIVFTRTAPAHVASDHATLVTFSVGGDLLAVPVESVERVLRWVPPSPLPQLPAWLDGVIAHSGRMVPVVDLRRRFGRETIAATTTTRIIVFAVGADWLGAVVDAVLDVISVDATRITAPPPVVRGLSGQYLLGLTSRDDRVVLVLDAARLLSSTEELELHAAASDSPEHIAALP